MPLCGSALSAFEREDVIDRVPQRIEVAAHGNVEGSAEARSLTKLGGDERIVRENRGIGSRLAQRTEGAQRRNLLQLGVEENQIEALTPKADEPLVESMRLGHVDSPATSKGEDFLDQLAIEIVVLDEEDFSCGDHESAFLMVGNAATGGAERRKCQR